MAGREAERSAMARALDLARTPGVPLGPNPRVGCVLLDQDGTTVAEGYHRGAGTPHAEVDALVHAGDRARGATAVVTLEPCDHTGRTGPCSRALLDAGIARVVFAQADTNPVARGGAETLRDAGVQVEGGLLVEEARAVNRTWTFAHAHRRPFVTWKLAATLDGRSAAADGSSRWVSSAPARRDSQRLRAECDAILAGTGTVLVDDPRLTARDEDDVDLPAELQPLRVVMGRRPLPAGLRVLDDAAPTVVLATRDPHEALAALYAEDRQHVLVEGGPTLAGAFLRAGLVDEVVAYVAPVLLGAGLPAVGDLGIRAIGDALHLDVREVSTVGTGSETNVRLTLTPGRRRTDMFTGIIEELGVVETLEEQGDAVRLTVRGPHVTVDARLGDSIAVNGCCLTVAQRDGETFTADVMRETLDKTSLGVLGAGDRVNLERAATPTTRLGGHIVQGHVDGTGTLVARTPSEHWELVEISLPDKLARYLVDKGSVTVDGVSLTVVSTSSTDRTGSTGRGSFTVSLIPETLARTTLGLKQAGDPVNLEVDVIAKYVERLLTHETDGDPS